MRARVPTDDGEHSEWFDVTHGAAARLRAITVTVQRALRCCVTRRGGARQPVRGHRTGLGLTR